MPTTQIRVYTVSISLDDKEWRYKLQTPLVQIGRGSQNDITLIDDKVSRVHARLSRVNPTEGGWQIEDLGSANGTWVNDTQLDANTATPVSETDAIRIGRTILRLVPALSALAPETADPNLEQTVLEATVIDHADGLQQTLQNEPMHVVVPNTNIARVAIYFQSHAWEVPFKTNEPPTQLSIGRAPDNDIVLNHPKVSRNHAHIELYQTSGMSTNGVRIVDHRSANHTFVNGEKITQRDLHGSESVNIGQATLIYKPAFAPDELIVPSTALGATGQVPKVRKPVVFVPGFMGSQLWLGNKLVWPNLRMLATQTEIYKLPEQHPLTVKGLVEEVVVVPNLYKQEQYSQLTEFLHESLGYQAGSDLLEFAYDWRKDLRLAAQQLKQQVVAWRNTLPDPTAKVILIAHSMGCLVARYFLDVLGGDQMTERVILMGGPHLGTPKAIVALLTGKGLLPFGMFGDRIRDAIATFPGAYQLLPVYPVVFDANDNPVDLFADARWAEEPFRTHIQNAYEFRSELRPEAHLPTLCIVGYGNKTVSRATIKAGANGSWADVKFTEDEEGDSTIPVASAILKGADIHPVHQSHGALFVDNDVRFRLKLELTK